MKKLLACFLSVFFSLGLSAHTITGPAAQALYDLIPGSPVPFGQFPLNPGMIVDMKVAGYDVHCAYRQDGSYKCNLPNKDNSGKIWLDETSSKEFYSALHSKGYLTMQLGETASISCQKTDTHTTPPSAIFKCSITL